MTILYIPNDPEARKAPPPRMIEPARARRRDRADFDFGTLPAEQRWEPGTREFLVWQCRESAMRALATWEKIAGPLARWQSGRRRLGVVVDHGAELNAYYDRDALVYCHFASARAKATRFFAASADVVAHEAGHAFLDATRPELWDSNYPEPNAFHEAFGDCIALLTALSDVDTRRALLKQDPELRRINFVETLIESLANGIREQQPDHNGAKPRHAHNRYVWALPSTLPDDGGPGELINEIHSFGQLFVGCFYDTLRNVFLNGARRDEKALWNAALTVGRLLARAAAKAPHVPRFFQSVGRTMTLEDDALHRGRHHDAIRLAFEAHGILLGSVAAIAPRAALRGAAPDPSTAQPLARATLDDLRERLGLSPRATFRIRRYELGGHAVAEACHLRDVPLTGLSPKLAGVVATGVEPTLVGGTNDRAAVLGALPDPSATEDEVRAFVASLVRRGAIAYEPPAARRRGAVRAIAVTGGEATHAVVRVDGRLELSRLRFSCGCAARRG